MLHIAHGPMAVPGESQIHGTYEWLVVDFRDSQRDFLCEIWDPLESIRTSDTPARLLYYN
jgi:hypothetical protein